MGKRLKRGLFQSSTGKLINSDVNGSLNILRKAVPNVFTDGIEGVAVHPKRVKSFKL
jgi:putative transposase